MYVQRPWPLFPLIALLLATFLVGNVSAQEKIAAPTPHELVDRQVYNSLRDVINQGADLYNGGDHAACYFLFHGALTAVGPVLEHRPELQKAILDGLHSARKLPRFYQRATALRGVLDRVRSTVGPARTAPATDTLWERLGGEANVKKIVDEFVAAAAADPKVNFLREGKIKEVDVGRLKKLLVEQISEVAGGPYKYTGRNMREVHKGLGISDAEFDALAGHLRKALEKNVKATKDVDAVLQVIGGTRKEIVEPKPAPSKKDVTSPPPVETKEKPVDPPKKPVDSPKKSDGASLWDRLGGEANVKKVVDDFVTAAGADPKVDFFRGGKPKEGDVDRLKKMLIEQISSVSDGPYRYSGLNMKEAHSGMGITDAQFDALVAHLKKALEKNGAKPEDVKSVLKVIDSTRGDIVEKKSEPKKGGKEK